MSQAQIFPKLHAAFFKYAPKFIKGYPLNEKKKYFDEHYWGVFCFYGLPLWIFFYVDQEARQLCLQKPTTDEERAAIRKATTTFIYNRDYEIGQYDYDIHPLYDTAARRSKYPEYYGDKYNGFKRYGDYKHVPTC